MPDTLDLTADELGKAIGLIDFLEVMNRRAAVDPHALETARWLARAATEVVRRRVNDARLMSAISKLRDGWATDRAAEREWLGSNFVEDLDDLIANFGVTP